MSVLRFLTAGESHGRGLTAVLEGVPAGLALSGERVARRRAPPPAAAGR